MRAVSSPSLCENPLDTVKCSKKPRRDETVQTVETHPPTSNNTTTSVLQKFRKTFSNLKGKSSISSNNGTALVPVNGGSNHVSNNSSVASINSSNTNSMVNTTTNPSFDSADIIKYRFGPLIWRTSKERRKTKHHRRDKCNSGDSGIQVELENDENVASNDMTDGMDALPSFNIRVRRANSAKVASNSMAATAKARVLKRNEGSDKLYLTPIPGRSLSMSQPYGLNQIAPCKYSCFLFYLCLPFVTSFFFFSYCQQIFFRMHRFLSNFYSLCFFAEVKKKRIHMHMWCIKAYLIVLKETKIKEKTNAYFHLNLYGIFIESIDALHLQITNDSH